MDATCVSQYMAKLKLLLENALKPNFSVNLNLLLTHFTSAENKEIAGALFGFDLFAEWIIEACTFWEENEDVQPTANLGCFVLELATLVSKNEERFLQLNSANAYLRLCDTFHFRKATCAVQIKLAYVKLLESFLAHKRGVEWIRATNTWIDVLNYCLSSNSSNDLTKASCSFLYKLLEGEICFDEQFCNTVVKRIMRPLMMNSLLSANNPEHIEINEQQLKTKITPTLQLIITLLQQYLNNECITRRYTHFPRIFFINHSLLLTVETYKLLLNDEELHCEIAHIIYLVNFITLSIDSKQHMITEDESVPVFEKVFFLMEEAMSRKHCTNVAKMAYYANNYWFLIHKRLLPMTHKDINKDPLRLQVQIVIMQVMPICQFVENHFKVEWNSDDIDDMRDFYIQKCCRSMNEYTFRLVYVYREAMKSSIHVDYKIAIKHMCYLQDSWKFYKNDAAVVLFQLLVYVLHDAVQLAKTDRVEFEMASKQADFFMLTIGTIKDLVENFEIKWTNCMESICVVNSALDFLMLMEWPSKLTVQALKLLKLSIEKYMSPNLALLVDRTSDSSLGQLGPLLLSKLQNSDWQVRDAALQVLITISELSHSKFFSFQELLQQEKFPCFVLKLCEQDPESFVRASALKCLQHMVQSTVLWDEFFKEQQQQLLKTTIEILNKERDGVIRLEAASLIHCLYSNQRFDEETTTEMNKIMATAATVDLHWAVKKKSLEFWNDVIWKRLSDQGMTDSNFPDVIFSKERRKIIKLDENEVKRRLDVVLHELNTNGCLQVLIQAIQDDLDIEVVEEAVKVTKKFVEVLRNYKVLQWQQCVDRYKCFFDLIHKDLDKVLENRRQWLKAPTDTFGMVLSDMLKELEQDEDMNVMECYY